LATNCPVQAMEDSCSSTELVSTLWVAKTAVEDNDTTPAKPSVALS
jgi:hypothetical protein